MLVCAVYCLYRSLLNPDSGLITAEIVISLAATYGCYLFASLIALDPWHLLTSFVPYMVLSPVWINLFNIYAFSNLHDFSWGTKGDDTITSDLGVTKKVGADTVQMDLPSAQADIDTAYDGSLHNLKTRPMIVPPAKSASQLTEAKKVSLASRTATRHCG